MRASISNHLARKIINLPRLSPTHTSGRIIERLVPSRTHVVEYQPVLILQCSPDLVADAADRLSPTHQPLMLIESMEEGTLIWNTDVDNNNDKEMINVGTILGQIVDEDQEEDDDENEDWSWQAYLHDDNDETTKS